MQLNQRILRIVGIVVAVVVVIMIAIPLLVDVNSFRPKIESELTSALGRQVTLGKLSLSVLSGSVEVKDISIADDPAFSKSPFVTAKSLKVGVELIPIIFSKKLNITGFALRQPEITLLKASNGTWNFSSLGATTTKRPAEPTKTSPTQGISVDKMEITDGRLLVGKANSPAKSQVYDSLNIEVENFSPTTQFPFQLSLGLPGGGKAEISGKAGPINPQDSAKTPLDVAIKVKNLDIAKSGFVDSSTGIGGFVDCEGVLSSNGTQGKAAGIITVEKLKLSPKGSPAPEPVIFKYALNSDLARDAGTITQGDVSIGKAVAKLTGGYQAQGETQVLNMKLSAPNLPVDEIEAMLPAVGVTFPSGTKLKGGTLSADLSITGPLERMVISGPVRLANAKLDGFDMGAKLGALSAFSGKARSTPDTTIQNASLNAHVAPELTRADAINVTISSLGTVTGSGTINSAGALDFSMLADLETARSDVRADRSGRAGGAIPFKIQGTTSNPSFVPDVAGMAGRAAKGAIQGAITGKTGGTSVPGVGGLFGRKKK